MTVDALSQVTSSGCYEADSKLIHVFVYIINKFFSDEITLLNFDLDRHTFFASLCTIASVFFYCIYKYT